MVIIKTPLRLPLAGGGTDLPGFYQKFGSVFLSVAINRFIYLTAHRSGFSDKLRVRYSRMEEVDDVEELEHDIVRESLKRHGIRNNLELTSHAEIPSGTGLGSSGSFGVGVLHALYALDGTWPSAELLAREASDIQMNALSYPIGLQDQYVAAYGGLNLYEVSREGRVEVSPLGEPGEFNELERRLVLFFTGYSREANQILAHQEATDMTETLKETARLGHEMIGALDSHDWDAYGRLLNDHWHEKKKRHPNMSNPDIDACYEKALECGALGGKLVGAGGGGFLLFYSSTPEKLIRSIELKHVPFNFAREGSIILCR